MKKILTLVFIVLFFKAGAQTSVTAVSTCGQTYYMRVTFTDEYVPVHNTSPVTCPDGSIHYDTEESQWLLIKMELFADPACALPVPVDPRFFSYCNCITASHGTRIQPTFLYRPDCSATIPGSSDYKDNWRTDRYLVYMNQCIWECVGGGYYNCYSTGEGIPTSYNIVMNCCFEPGTLAVHLVSFDGVRSSGLNALSWRLENKQDFARLQVERSFDGLSFSSIYSITDASVSTYGDRTDITAYYRLKLFNTNGTFFYSSVVVLKAGAAVSRFNVSPSPFKDVLQVSVTTSKRLASVIKLVSAEGKTVFATTRELKPGVNQLSLTIPVICKGVYILSISNDEGTLSKKVLKQ